MHVNALPVTGGFTFFGSFPRLLLLLVAMRSGGRSGIFSCPGIRLGGGIGRRLILKPELMPLSLFVPRNVGCSANGFWGYSGGTRGVKNERAGGEYDGSSAANIAMVAWPLLIKLWPVGRRRVCNISLTTFNDGLRKTVAFTTVYSVISVIFGVFVHHVRAIQWHIDVWHFVENFHNDYGKQQMLNSKLRVYKLSWV